MLAMAEMAFRRVNEAVRVLSLILLTRRRLARYIECNFDTPHNQRNRYMQTESTPWFIGKRGSQKLRAPTE